MRTTLDIEDDVLYAAKELAARERVTASVLISRLLRAAISGTAGAQPDRTAAPRAVAGFQPFEAQGVLVTNAQINALRDVEGV
ncbi:hypothetical protein [Rhodoferax sp.]|uniref:hypothetical protein n=1 Tax=Rhodoferax sp. TaxID=50421 RepID=UPI001A0595E1|nr:hypothetical protein [Rhodoferax sp.]MBE0474960.1 hypothetical protein [Rhodoferax sp.]